MSQYSLLTSSFFVSERKQRIFFPKFVAINRKNYGNIPKRAGNQHQ